VLVVFRPARAVRPLLPKMLLRLSLDMPRDGVGDAPPGTSSAAQESTLQVRSTCAAARGGQVERAVKGRAPPMALQIASYCVVSAGERLISTASSRWLRHVLATRRRRCEARRKKQARKLSSAPAADGGARAAALRGRDRDRGLFAVTYALAMRCVRFSASRRSLSPGALHGRTAETHESARVRADSRPRAAAVQSRSQVPVI
jgi:hypothetical protein